VAKRGFLVTFGGSGGEPDVHRIRNWAEDLFVDARTRGYGTVENADSALDRVWVVASSGRALGDLAQAIRRSLGRHNLLDHAIVSKLTGSAESEERERVSPTRGSPSGNRDDG
jgi:hypothetical protein